MNKRLHARRRRRRAQPGSLLTLAGRGSRKRRVWTFERLEDRYFLSATPFSNSTGDVQHYSSNTPEGLQQILLNEYYWALLQENQSATSEASNLLARALPNDPYLQYQWHLVNLGQSVGSPDFDEILAVPGEDINVSPVWDMGYTGEGVVVAVIDSGVEVTHPDLAANFDPNLVYWPLGDLEGDSTVLGDAVPNLGNVDNAHGTAIAGLIGAVGNNELGMTGVAYNATLVPIRLIDGSVVGLGGADLVDYALRYENQIVDIYNNSWGPQDAPLPGEPISAARVMTAPTGTTALALRDGVFFGRDPDGPGGDDALGSIFVWASGNGAGPAFSDGFTNLGVWDSATYDGYVNSRYTIGVGGVDHDGLYNNADGTVSTTYEAGPAILVAAPTGSNPIYIGDEVFIGSGLWTLDATGSNGFNQAPLANGNEVDRDFFGFPDYEGDFEDYTSFTGPAGGGTSASAGIVSGVIALMLEANPNLSWRDVQEILVRSARQTDIEDPVSGSGTSSDQSWIVNYRDFFRVPDPIQVVGDPNNQINPTASVFNPTPTVTQDANPAFFPNGPLTGVLAPFYIITPPIAGDPNAMPPVPFTPGQLQIAQNYAPAYQEQFVNGAGYTVSAGRGVYGDEFGYGHGVIDAELAVELARQWTIQDQHLPDELTYTTFVEQPILVINGSETQDEDNGQLRVPGALADPENDPFLEFWDQYFEEYDDEPPTGPFSDEMGYDGAGPSDRGGFYYLQLPDTPDAAMSVEWVEVKLDLGNMGEDFNYVRMTLVSPSGTQSELVNQFPDPGIPYSLQVPSASNFIVNGLGDISPNATNTWVYSTNRNWGERYDNQLVYDPATGNPLLDDNGTPFILNDGGKAVEHGWHLVFENYSETDFDVDGIEVIWHGSPIDSNTERVQGIVGVDSGYLGAGANDGQFAYSPFVQRTEPGAANVLVTATRVSDGVVVDKFLTGADGNFYFDLLPDEYIISVDDPLGRTVLDEQNVPAGFLPLYQSEWHITPSYFFEPDVVQEPVVVPNRPARALGNFYGPDVNTRVIDDGSGGPHPFFDNFGTIVNGPRYINFLLDPGPAPGNDVLVSGNVFADLDADGIFNNNDAPGVDFIVYADLNNSGQFEATDAFTLTDQAGNYELHVTTTSVQRYDIGALPPTTNWEQTFPSTEFTPVLGGPGTVVQNINFGFEPIEPPEPPPDPQPGSILGVVYNDANANGIREAGELGVSGVHVYVDLDNDDVFTAGEPEAVTGSNGAYFLADVESGFVAVRIDVPDDWEATNPASATRVVDLPSAGTATNILFGIRNLATDDWGDLPDTFLTTADQDGPHHLVVPGFHLGSKIDSEVDGQPTPMGDGDDAVSGDEDGVVVLDMFGDPDPLKILRVGDATDADATTLRVTVAGVGGLLTGWIDFDGSGTFEASEKLTWKDPEGDLVQEVDLNPGTYDLPITVPDHLVSGQVAARFRWGEAGLDYFGPAVIGEVEDYYFDPPELQQQGPPDLLGDYNYDDVVNEDDYAVWRSAFGTFVTPGTGADGNGDGMIDAADYVVWRDNEGAVAPQGGGGGGGESTAVASTSTVPDPERVAAFEAQMEALGFQKITIRVGLDGTQTLWYVPSSSTTEVTAESTTASTRALVAATLDADSSSHDRPGLHFVSTVDGRPGASSHHAHHRGVDSGSHARLELLDHVMSHLSRCAAHDDMDDDTVSIAETDGDQETRELALASVLEDDDWRQII